MAFIHPLVILAAVFCGIYAGTLGWKRFQYKRGKATAADFPWQRHIRWGKTFFILLCIGVLIGDAYMLYTTGAILTTGLHAYLGIIIVTLFFVGTFLGVLLSKRKGADRMALIHMGINYGTFLLVAFQIVLGILLLGFFYSG